MIDFSKYRIVDLTPRLIGRVKKLDGTIIEGEVDSMGIPWPMQERRTVGMDDSAFMQVGGWADDPKFPNWGFNAHFGLHTEGGIGHLDHWEGMPDTMKGLWDYPIDSFMGPAAVCDLTPLKPLSEQEAKGVDGADYHNKDKDKPPHRGQPIKPEHLSNVQEGDIVIMWSSYTGVERPYIPAETAEWLASMKIKMLAVQMTNIMFDTAPRAEPPNNSPTHRTLIGNNIAITYPLANCEQLTKDRVIYIGLPLNVVHMDASWVRAIALEEL